MNTNYAGTRQTVYMLINGFLNCKEYPVSESQYVASIFTPGSPCERAYCEVLQAYQRISQKLHPEAEEDADVEIIINNMMTIAEEVGNGMFDYGVLFAQKGLLPK